jgi:hypothetical protein
VIVDPGVPAAGQKGEEGIATSIIIEALRTAAPNLPNRRWVEREPLLYSVLERQALGLGRAEVTLLLVDCCTLVEVGLIVLSRPLGVADGEGAGRRDHPICRHLVQQNVILGGPWTV